MSKLDDAIARAKASAPSRQSSTTLDLLLGEEFHTFEFTRIDPQLWVDLKATCPPREGAKNDALAGYNPIALAKKVAPVSGKLVDGDEREAVPADQWADIFAVLDAPAIEVVATVLWGLNEYDALQRIAAAKKALRGGRKKRRS